jgi:predicted sugar kinase
VCPSKAFCHIPALSVDDNEDGTIYIEVGFSDGGSGAGHTIILKEEESGKIIAQYTVPKESALTVQIPEVPYTVTFDAGVGHKVTRKGPAAAVASVSQQQVKQPVTLEEILTLAPDIVKRIEALHKQVDRLTHQIEEDEIQKAELEKQIREELSALDSMLKDAERQLD